MSKITKALGFYIATCRRTVLPIFYLSWRERDKAEYLWNNYDGEVSPWARPP